MAKKAAIYCRISNEGQRKSSLQQNDCERVNENGLSFIVCHKCGWTGMANTLSCEETKERKRYPKPKCPFCK